MRSPDLYTDLELLKPRAIHWHSYNNVNESPVKIDLYQDGPGGPQFLANIIPSTPDDGDFSPWIPATTVGNNAYGMRGLRIQISLVNNPAVSDRSTEPSTVPEFGDTYYVDDASDAGDEYTIPDAQHPSNVGSNRNTGKLPTAPKPNPVNVLRTYELTAGATLNIDTGVYPLIYTATMTSRTGIGLGTDRGFLFRGPTNTNKVAELTTAIPNNATQNLLYLYDADLMQIRNLTLTGGQYGIYVTGDGLGASTGLDAQNLTIHDNALTGLYLDQSSDFSLLKNITSFNHVGNGDGIDIIGGAGGTIQNLVSYNNRYGLYTSSNALAINGASLHDNRATGLRQDGGTTGTFDGLDVYANNTGPELTGNITITNSKVHDNVSTGISSGGSINLQSSEVYGNTLGVYTNFGSITGSQIYSNAGPGIQTGQAGIVIHGNFIYSNQYALYTTAYQGAFDIGNNLIYGDSIAAIRLTNYGPSAYDIVTTTIFEPTADGIYATTSDNIHLRNNIIWTQAGYGVFIADDSQNDFTSDYNDFYRTGAGRIGYWQGDRQTLTD